MKAWRELSKYHGERGKVAFVYKDLNTELYIVEKVIPNFSPNATVEFEERRKAEFYAEDWIMRNYSV